MFLELLNDSLYVVLWHKRKVVQHFWQTYSFFINTAHYLIEHCRIYISVNSHPSDTNQARCRVTSLTESNVLTATAHHVYMIADIHGLVQLTSTQGEHTDRSHRGRLP